MPTAARTSHTILPRVCRHSVTAVVALHITCPQQHGRRVDDQEIHLVQFRPQPPGHSPATLRAQKAHLGGLALKPQLLTVRISGENNCSRLLVIPKPGHCSSE